MGFVRLCTRRNLNVNFIVLFYQLERKNDIPEFVVAFMFFFFFLFSLKVILFLIRVLKVYIFSEKLLFVNILPVSKTKIMSEICINLHKR